MIAFQHIKSGRYLASRSDWSHSPTLANAFPFHRVDESPMRERFPALSQYRTVEYSIAQLIRQDTRNLSHNSTP